MDTVSTLPRRVGFWMRTAAMLIDLAACGILAIVAAAVCGATGALSGRWLQLVPAMAWVAYWSAELFASCTPGKLILGLRIAQYDAVRAGPSVRLLRYSTKHFAQLATVASVASGWPQVQMVTGQAMGFVVFGCLMALDERKRAWHDQWSHTAIYRVRDVRPDLAGAGPTRLGTPAPT